MGEDASLYARILVDGWAQLPAPVRCLHATRQSMRARGEFRVEYGPHPLAPLFARLLRMPAACDAVETRLTVTALDAGERWERVFGTSRIETLQLAGPSTGQLARQPASQSAARGSASDLVERFGLLELRFRLDACERDLRYHQRDAAVRWRSVYVRIPAWLAPRIEAHEEPVGTSCVKARVQIALPAIGTLMIYEGIITVDVEARLEDLRA